MHHSVSHVSGPQGGSLAAFFMVDISYHGDILMSPDTHVNLKVIYPDEYMEGFEPIFSSWHVYQIHMMNFIILQSTVPTCTVWIHEHWFIYLHMFMQIRRAEAYAIQITVHTVPMHQNTTYLPQLAHTHTHKRPGRDLTLCFSVNMTDREKAAGCCVDDACSHQSFNLFLSVLPAETLFFPPGPSVTQSYCLSLFVIHWHSF